MAVYYVGAGGNDANNGLTWATRKLTLNGAEDVPVVAGDTIYVAPGVYREMLTCDVSGGAGSSITYIGDVSGENTDGVGGVVRVTGSDNDQAATRASCVTCAAQRNYRTFRGFMLDTTTSYVITGGATAGTNWIIEDCNFQITGTAIIYGIYVAGANQLAWTIRRCVFLGLHQANSGCITYHHTGKLDNTGHLVENCIFISTINIPIIYSDNGIGGITIRNCLFRGGTYGFLCLTALNVGQTVNVNNSIFYCHQIYAVRGAVAGEVVEDYNTFFGNGLGDRLNVNIGANSVTYPPIFDLGILYSGASQISGFRFPPPLLGALSQWSQVRAIADTGAATEDILGLPRPVTAGKRSWGAVQYVDMARDTATVHAGTASKKFADAGRDQIYVPAVAVSTVFSVYVYREANYAGVNPQMILKQPGQADTVVTDAGAAGTWNQLTTTLTPAASPGYVVVELVSNNTAAAGNYATYFDDLTVV